MSEKPAVQVDPDEALLMEAWDFGQFSKDMLDRHGLVEPVRLALQRVLEKMQARLYGLPWTPASSPPDADTTVLLALSDGEVWQGYLDGEIWRDTSGMPLASARVTHWMHVPAHPEPEAKAAPIRTSTGFCCASCCAKAGEPHVAGCPESPAPATIQSWHTGLPLPGAKSTNG